MLLLCSWLEDEAIRGRIKRSASVSCRSPGKAIPALEDVLEICWTSWSPSPERENKPCLSGTGQLWVLPWGEKPWEENPPAAATWLELRSSPLNSPGKQQHWVMILFLENPIFGNVSKSWLQLCLTSHPEIFFLATPTSENNIHKYLCNSGLAVFRDGNID